MHLGIQGLTQDKVSTVYILPQNMRPKTKIFCVGMGGEFGHISRLEIAVDGGINVTSQDSYAACDITYDVY